MYQGIQQAECKSYACLNTLVEPLKDEAATCPCKSDLNIATSCHTLLEIIIFNWQDKKRRLADLV